MAGADLDVVIRQLAKQQHRSLMARAKERRDHYNGLAAKAKDTEARDRCRQLAKTVMEHAATAARRLQMSADNVADSYARSIRLAEAAPAVQKPEKKQSDTKKPAEKKQVKKGKKTK